MWLFAFILFAILGYCVFVKPPSEEGKSRLLMMIVFCVLMLLWALAGLTGFEIPPLRR